MKAIAVKFVIGDVKHTFTASDQDHNSVRHERDNSIQFEENYDAAARKLCDRMGWTGTLMKGHVNGSTRVYVWVRDEDKLDIQPHPFIRVGQCPICKHFGKDCTGTRRRK